MFCFFLFLRSCDCEMDFSFRHIDISFRLVGSFGTRDRDLLDHSLPKAMNRLILCLCVTDDRTVVVDVPAHMSDVILCFLFLMWIIINLGADGDGLSSYLPR